MKRSIALRLLLLLALAPCACSAADAPEPCTIVYSQPRNHSDSDPAVNSMWNRVNDAFNQFVSEELRGAGRRVLAMSDPVEARDTRANLDRVMQRAVAEHCATVVDVSMYADQGASQFVSSMRVLPIISSHESIMRRGTNHLLGKEVFATERRDPLTRETLDALSPGAIAREFVGAYVARSGSRP